MKSFMVKPTIRLYDHCDEFVEDFHISETDLLLTNARVYKHFFAEMNLPWTVLFRESYGSGEPTDDMAEAIYRDIPATCRRVFAIGGGSIIDLAKLFILKDASPFLDLFDGKKPFQKDRELIVLPTTCGTGSEVTNVAVLALNSRGTKKGLAVDAMYPDCAVLIPELVSDLPFKFFATSSIDALIHAVESTLSPKGNVMTRMFGYRAIDMILNGYKKIAAEGPDARFPLLGEFLTASCFAGIAFGNTGCAAVHAMSYPLGSTFHVPHGESNYAMFTGVMKNYMEIKQDGEIATLNKYIADILGCDPANVYEELEKLLNQILQKKALHEYGMTKEQIVEFTDSVIENQQRLLKNNFVFLDRDRLIKIYTELF